MRILLIRHAEPDYTVDSLTPKGRTEAELLSRRLVRYDIRDFYVSPLGRAEDTAAYTLDKLGREAETLPWLREFHGSYPDPETGKRRIVAWDVKPRIWKAFPGVMDINTWCDAPAFAGGDVREVWDETVDGVNALLARYGCVKDGPVWHMEQNGDFTIALFCHFGLECVLLSHLLNISPMPLWHGTCAAPTSVTTLTTEERREGIAAFRMNSFGDISHLYCAGREPSFSARFCETYQNFDQRHD